MSAQLWLLRHGEAEPHGARTDADRRLTERGEEQSRAAGRALAALGVTFQLVVTSPRVRARDTAALACEALDSEPVADDSLDAGAGADAALALLAAAGRDGRVLLVGHNPDFEQIVYDLTGADVEMKKGGVAAIRVNGRRGELIALLRPRELARVSQRAVPEAGPL